MNKVCKWNELDYAGFKGIARDFWYGKSYTIGKVLELQLMTPLLINEGRRIYFGRGINKIREIGPNCIESMVESITNLMNEDTAAYVMDAPSTFFLISIDTKSKNTKDVVVLPIRLPADPNGRELDEDSLGEVFENTWSHHFSADKSVSEFYFPNWYTRNEEDNRIEAYFGGKDSLSFVEDAQKLFKCRAINTSDWQNMVIDMLYRNCDVLWTEEDTKSQDIDVNEESGIIGLLQNPAMLRRVENMFRSMLDKSDEDDD